MDAILALADPNPSGICLCGCGHNTTAYYNSHNEKKAGILFRRKYVLGHGSKALRGPCDRHGFTQYARSHRNDAIWHFIHHLLPVRQMKRTGVHNLVLPRWPEKRKCDIGHIINSGQLHTFLIPEPKRTKPCSWCGKAHLDCRCRWCSSECEKADKADYVRRTKREPILESISLLCKDFYATEHDCLSHLAFEVVKTATGAFHPSLVASAWIGVQAAWEAGERNKPDLILAAENEIRKFKKTDRLSWLSIDNMKESYNYEPVASVEVASADF